MTNEVINNEAPKMFQKLAEFNGHLMGAPVGVLLFMAVIGIGYILRVWHKCPNNIIPIVQVFLGLGLWLLVCPGELNSDSLRVWWGRNLLIGIIIPTSAWLTQRAVLKKIEKKFGLFTNGDSLDSQVETKTVVSTTTITPSTKP